MPGLAHFADSSRTSRELREVPTAVIAAIRGTGFMERSAASIRLSPRELDHLGPLLGFLSDELAEVGRRERERGVAEVGNPRPDPRIGEARVDLPVELVDHLNGRIPGRTDAVPRARLVAWHEVAYGRDVQQRVRALRGGDRQRAQRARPDIPDR